MESEILARKLRIIPIERWFFQARLFMSSEIGGLRVGTRTLRGQLVKKDTQKFREGAGIL